MSLAILTTALTRLVGVEFDYRKVNTIPVFEQQNNLLLSSSHVQTKLYDPSVEVDKNFFYTMRPSVVIDYFPNKNNITSSNYSYRQFLGLYYKNIASDAAVDNQLTVAFTYANTAYQYDRQNPEILNLIAVLHRRMGDEKTAEDIYKSAISMEKNNLSVINNYIVLLEGQKRFDEALTYKNRINALDDPNPYSWLEQAYISQNQQEYSNAAKHYKKIIELAPYVHQAYLGLYHVYQSLNKPDLANKALKKGLEWTYIQKDRELFKYKLYAQNAE